MRSLYPASGIFLSGFSTKLGGVRRDLNSLEAARLLSNPAAALARIGYQNNFGVGSGEDLLTLAGAPLAEVLRSNANPRALVFHHSYAESAMAPRDERETDIMSRARYFPANLMKGLELDHLPFFGSFASGCTGFISLLLTGSGLLGCSGEGPVICLTADVKPPGVSYDALREKILTSDCASGFALGHEPCGYQLLGINYYSTTRTLVPLVEIVKRTVQMIRDLAKDLDLDLAAGATLAHYPNIFPEAWQMVTQYLKLPREHHVLEGMGERAHCLSSDSTISLSRHHRGERGRIHLVVNFGSGLHLGVCALREEPANAPGH